MAANAKRAATEIIDVYGEGAQRRLSELESQAFKKRAIMEYFYWKLVGEYVRERKS